jgi:hypothetical protein
MNRGAVQSKTFYVTDTTTPAAVPFPYWFRPLTATLPGSRGIDLVFVAGGYPIDTNNLVSATSDTRMYVSEDGGTNWSLVPVALPYSNMGGLVGVEVNGNRYLVSTYQGSIYYAQWNIANKTLGAWAAVSGFTVPSVVSSPSSAASGVRAVVMPDGFNKPQVGRVVFAIPDNSSGISLIRTKGSNVDITQGGNWESVVISSYTTNSITTSGSPFLRTPDNLMLSTGISSVSGSKKRSLYLMTGNSTSGTPDQNLWVSSDYGTTWRNRTDVNSIPSLTDNGGTATGKGPFIENGDMMADRYGNVILFGEGATDLDQNFYQMYMNRDLAGASGGWSQQKVVWSLSGLMRRVGGRAVRVQVGAKDALLIVGGIGTTTARANAVDQTNFIFRTFQRDLYNIYGVPSVFNIGGQEHPWDQ